MKSSSIRIIKSICQFLPPIMAQQVRERLMSNREAEELAMDFKRKSFTGGYLSSNTKDFHAFKFFVHGYYDWRNVVLAKKILKINNGDFIEVGANIGTETVSLAKINKFNKVHAFEPVLENFQQLRKIKTENEFKNLFIYNVLVAEHPGKAKFRVPQFNNSGSGHITSDTKNIEEITTLEMVTLDEKLDNIELCSAILIDVEGFEYQVLRGAKEIISRFSPFLILEVNEKFIENRAGITVLYLHQHLEKMGYRSFYIQKMGLKEVNPQDFKVSTNKNWLCIPKEKLKYKKFLSRSIYLNAINPLISKYIF